MVIEQQQQRLLNNNSSRWTKTTTTVVEQQQQQSLNKNNNSWTIVIKWRYRQILKSSKPRINWMCQFQNLYFPAAFDRWIFNKLLGIRRKLKFSHISFLTFHIKGYKSNPYERYQISPVQWEIPFQKPPSFPFSTLKTQKSSLLTIIYIFIYYLFLRR